MGMREEERTRRGKGLGRGKGVVWKAEVQGTVCEEKIIRKMNFILLKKKRKIKIKVKK